MFTVVEMAVEARIPKEAVKSLIEHCGKLGEETGREASEVFKEFLELMKKYMDYFFSEPWPQTLDRTFGFGEVEKGFIKSGKSYKAECERFNVVLLKRNISLEGFDGEGFDEDFKFYGRKECWDCGVPDAVRLRQYVKDLEEDVKKFEEEVKGKNPSWLAVEMSKHYKKPEEVKSHKMSHVELKVYEDVGETRGKSCSVENKYKCPYRARSKMLIKAGGLAKFIWQQILWYDHHWNPSEDQVSDVEDKKWTHYNEPGIIDVTSYGDIVKAINDGRFEKIVQEHKKYMEETGAEPWQY